MIVILFSKTGCIQAFPVTASKKENNHYCPQKPSVDVAGCLDTGKLMYFTFTGV